MFVFLIVALLALSYVLSRSTDFLVTGIRQLAKGTAFESYGLTAVLVAVATSLPELFVGVAAALRMESELSLGVVLGSNIANVSLVVGGAALLMGVVKAGDKVYKKDIVQAILIGSLPLLLLFDGRLSRMEGLVLVLIYGFFAAVTVNQNKRRQEHVEEEYFGLDMGHRVLNLLGKKDVEQGLLRLTVGSVALLVSAELVVRLAEQVSIFLGIPVILVGLFMVSVGATLPELTFEIKSLGRSEYGLVFGNLVGSVVANSSLILGIVAMLAPISLNGDSESYYVSVLAFVVLSLMFWGMTYSKRKLERWEGGVLVLAYFVFVVVQMVLA